MRHLLARAMFALVLLAALTMVVQTGSVPHLHLSGNGGLFNQEHDLTLLAGLAAQGLPADPPPVIVETVSTIAPALGRDRPAVRLAHSAESRAPPAV